MEIEDLEKRIRADVSVELADEFDRNFERKAFFNEKWESPKLNNSRGSTMARSGNLRRSIQHRISDDAISFSSSLPYASIHNEGGEIVVTAQMKKFFWAMYYKSAGAITTKANGEASKSKKNVKLTGEAAQWKALALMKIGHKMQITKRQFVGDHPEVGKLIKGVIDLRLEDFNQELIKKLQQ